MKGSNRLESLTFFRFIAAASVVIFHYGRDTQVYKNLPSVLAAGSIAVTFFFVLSGFVIAISTAKRDFSIGGFYVDRLARIFPVYFIALISTVSLIGLEGKKGEFILSVAMVQSWVSPYPLSLNMPSWSVSVEVAFYFLAPILILFARRGLGSPVLWIAASCVFWFVTQMILSSINKSEFATAYPSHAVDIVYYFPLSHFCSFLLGFAGGYAYSTGRHGENYPVQRKLLLFVLSVVLIYALSKAGRMINDSFGEKFAYGSSFYSLVFLFFIYCCAICNGVVPWFIKGKLSTLLGDASYSLYIIQMPVYLVFSKFYPSSNEGCDSRFWSYFIILVAVSLFLHLFIERPIVMFVKKRRIRTDGEIPATA
ncbi:acyltransferase family protein [Pseudomonas atacamensis]|uniref:acyltransferase family protein n=1 Tax=Pseudomonas atacamensis TaxID=2565368 RepID=UPI0038142D70